MRRIAAALVLVCLSAPAWAGARAGILRASAALRSQVGAISSARITDFERRHPGMRENILSKMQALQAHAASDDWSAASLAAELHVVKEEAEIYLGRTTPASRELGRIYETMRNELMSSQDAAISDSLQRHMLVVKDGERLSYALGGNEHGASVVLIHGFPFSSAMWASQVDALKKDYRIVAVDLRGAGESESKQGPFTMEMLVDDLIELMDHVKLSKAVVVGFSMGGFLSLRAIERNPERFEALVLADTRSGADANESKLRRTAALKTVRSEGVGAFADVFLKSAVAPATLKNPDLMRRLKALASGNSSKGVIEALFALMSRTDTTAALPRIKAPTLVLVGDSDAVTPPAAAQELHQGIAGSRLEIIPDAGHMSPVENPGVFNERLLSFLRSLPR